jgi:hypothetical protein
LPRIRRKLRRAVSAPQAPPLVETADVAPLALDSAAQGQDPSTPNAEDGAPPFFVSHPWIPPKVTEAQIEAMLERIRALSLDGGPPSSQIPVPQEDLETLTPDELWVRTQGWTPLEFLSFVYRNPFLPMAQRVNAAKSLLEFVHKPRARMLEAMGQDGDGQVTLTSGRVLNLGELNDADLDAVARVLDRAGARSSAVGGSAPAAGSTARAHNGVARGGAVPAVAHPKTAKKTRRK